MFFFKTELYPIEISYAVLFVVGVFNNFQSVPLLETITFLVLSTDTVITAQNKPFKNFILLIVETFGRDLRIENLNHQ